MFLITLKVTGVILWSELSQLPCFVILNFPLKSFCFHVFPIGVSLTLFEIFSIYFKPRKFLFSKHILVFANKRYNYKKIQFLGGKKNADATCYKEV